MNTNAFIYTWWVRKLTAQLSTGSDNPEENLTKYTSVLEKIGIQRTMAPYVYVTGAT